MKTDATSKGNWSEIKEQLRINYPWLTAGDLSYNDIYGNDFLTNLQLKTGKPRKQLLDELTLILVHW